MVRTQKIELKKIKPVKFPSSRQAKLSEPQRPEKSTCLVVAEMKKLAKKGIYVTE